MTTTPGDTQMHPIHKFCTRVLKIKLLKFKAKYNCIRQGNVSNVLLMMMCPVLGVEFHNQYVSLFPLLASCFLPVETVSHLCLSNIETDVHLLCRRFSTWQNSGITESNNETHYYQSLLNSCRKVYK